MAHPESSLDASVTEDVELTAMGDTVNTTAPLASAAGAGATTGLA